VRGCAESRDRDPRTGRLLVNEMLRIAVIALVAVAVFKMLAAKVPALAPVAKYL
jgi:hypothetical protein